MGPAGAARALAVLGLLAAAACASGPGADEGAAAVGADGPDRAGAVDRPVVETAPPSEPLPFLDPEASPRTALGRLRARHLPVWAPELDSAFPPEACHTAWELDGIAEPASAAALAVLGDLAAAGALAVMRYEHQFSRALAEPGPLAQLCVATASVATARADALAVLESFLESGSRRSEPAAFPQEVQILAVSPNAALSVACVTPGYPAVVGADGTTLDAPQAPARLQAYLLSVSRGLEDRVVDISYRVSDTAQRPAEDCGELDAWTAEWGAHVQDWVDEGQLWELLGATVTVGALCASPPPAGPDECPLDWPL